MLQGGAGGKKRREALAALAAIPEGEEFLVLATVRYIGEGFDDARLDTLLLRMPVSWRGTVVQNTDRLHRLHSAKSEERIYDYVDRRVPVLARTYERRLTGYRAIGYERSDDTMLSMEGSREFARRRAPRQPGRANAHERRAVIKSHVDGFSLGRHGAYRWRSA